MGEKNQDMFDMILDIENYLLNRNETNGKYLKK